jgi:hypothetical protein
MRKDQVYVITGGGMEYVVTESRPSSAHVIVNYPIKYTIERDKFVFFDQEGRPHAAKIARQTLIEPGALVKSEPRIWKSVPGGDRFSVRRSEGSIYAERLRSKGDKTVPVTYQAKWNGQDFYVGTMYWAFDKCSASFPLELKRVSPERYEGSVKSPTAGAKLEKKRCTYDRETTVRFVWVPE